MKKFSIMIFVLLLLCTSWGCATKQTSANSIIFYYTRNNVEFGTDSGIIIPVTRDIKQSNLSYQQQLEIYLNGPINYESISPFPAGTTLEDFQLDNNKVQLTFSPHLSTLTGTDLMIACACMTQTVTQMTGIDTVQIRVEGALINGQEILTLSNDSFTFFDSTTPDDFKGVN